MKILNLTLNESRNVTFTAYLQEVKGEFAGLSARPAMLILPGGGYQFCSDREADPVAAIYLQAGYQVFILHYSLGEQALWPNPLQDYETAAEMIRKNAVEWNVNEKQLGVIGFSAGGHLAACAATMAENAPNAVVLGYPVISEEIAHRYVVNAPDPAKAVSQNTCPVFLFAARDDEVVPVTDILYMAKALADNEVSFECHIYAKGGHGFSTCDSTLQKQSCLCTRTPDWVLDSVAWLKETMGSYGGPDIDET